MESSTEKPHCGTDSLHSTAATSLQSSYYGRSSYIGSIQALSVYYDEEELTSSPPPFAVDESDLNLQSNNDFNLQSQNDLNLQSHDLELQPKNDLQKSTMQKSVPSLNDHPSPGVDEGGIIILNPDEDEHDVWNDLHSEHHSNHISEPLDSIIEEAAARVNARIDNNKGNEESFEQLMQQAESGEANTLEVEADSAEHKSFWSRFQRNTSSQQVNQSAAQLTQPQLPPPRTTRIRHDKFLIEIDILPQNSRNNVRDAIDILANINLLHLWFDPIPAVFDSTIQDGSGTLYSPLQNSQEERHKDGEWIEISTPPLVYPKDSRISSCLRCIRVTLRSMVGFPARTRSTLLIERGAGRMGMTIPYPDGTTVYHDFNVKLIENRIVVSDEVRMHHSQERNYLNFCCLCGVLRFIFRILEWAFVRWYQPDLASYMSQTTGSMEKLRRLIERGEGMAYSEELEGDVDNSTLISAPLLG